MILSHKQLEEIAEAVMHDFNKYFFGDRDESIKRFMQATPIDQFASDFLGLKVSFTRLSQDGSICGLTAYADTEYVLEDDNEKRTTPLRQNQILLDESFIQPGQVHRLCGKRRFTLAHECAHQILYQCESNEIKASSRKKYAASSFYSLCDLKTREDWNEWQANVLGAAILMPQKEIDFAMQLHAKGRKLVNYDGKFSNSDSIVLSIICKALGISKAAAAIRLRQLGHLEDRSYREFADSPEVCT